MRPKLDHVKEKTFIEIYLAARYSRREELLGYKSVLEGIGHTVTSRWLLGNHEGEDHQRFAMEDWHDLITSDCCISFTEPPRSGPTRGGRHVEFGAALAQGLHCIVIGPRENVFHYLPQVYWYPDWRSFCLEFGIG